MGSITKLSKKIWALIVLSSLFVGLLAYGGSLWVSFIYQKLLDITKE